MLHVHEGGARHVGQGGAHGLVHAKSIGNTAREA